MPQSQSLTPPQQAALSLKQPMRLRKHWGSAGKGFRAGRERTFGFCADLRNFYALGIKIAQKPYTVWSLGPKALIYEFLEP